MDKFSIRPAMPSDAAQLSEIYRPYVENTAVSFEFEAPSVELFRLRIDRTLAGYPYLAAISSDGTVIGYAYASQFHSRPAYRYCAQPSIYIDGRYHGIGVGRALYQKLEDILIKQNVLTMCSCIAVPESPCDPYLTNDSELFHRKMGYETVGRHACCGYKFGRWYGVIWMEKRLRERPDNPDPFVPYPEIACYVWR